MSEFRKSPIELSKEEFRKIGHQLIDDISEFISTIHQRPVAVHQSPSQIRQIIGDHSLPQEGSDPTELLPRAAEFLFDHSLFNGHPKFLGYINSSGAPIGALADLLAASVNPNVGAHILSPMATAYKRVMTDSVKPMVATAFSLT